MNFPFLTSLVQRQNVQKQPFATVFQNKCSSKFRNIHSKTPLMESFFLNKAAGLQGCKFIEKRLQHRLFPVNIAKTFQNSFLYKAPSLAASEFAKSFFTYWLGIHKVYLKTRVALQILSHEARHKIPVEQLISQYTYWLEDCEFI